MADYQTTLDKKISDTSLSKKRIHPLEGTNAFASAVPPWLGCCYKQKFPGDGARGKKPASLIQVRQETCDTFCLDNGGSSGSGYLVFTVLPATQRSIHHRCTGRLSPFRCSLYRLDDVYSSSSQSLFISLYSSGEYGFVKGGIARVEKDPKGFD